MNKKKISSNGRPKDLNKELEGVEIEFPVSFQLKAVIEGSDNEEESKRNIVAVLGELKIPNEFNGTKVSSKGTYTSYHFNITLTSKTQMKKMYEAMKSIPGFKFAL